MTRNQPKRPRPGIRGIGLAAALVLAASLTGCGPADTGLPREASRQLQELVLGVSQAAAANDHSAALGTLETLEADLTTAAASGQVSEERRRRIMTSIAAVRADLMAAIDAAAAGAKAAEEAAAAAAAADAEKAKADADTEGVARSAQEYTAPVVAVPLPAPHQAPGQKKGNEGKGKNKDN
ncbi:hypothetical protein [Arthrobacter sp. SO3]|uniref:hypothetical protein n=1 Tax=Arthrobacter sp. SO3 TaxID=1897057 RepID=UPI001CFF5928|nr:hypothetical protein [Arthrobacter sp. SO3]MCB5293403.1 hypothetical protein [Arthrobacter sp. SO3]